MGLALAVVQCYDTVGWVVTRKTVSEMTYNVSSGTLNSTTPIPIMMNLYGNQAWSWSAQLFVWL